MEFGMVGLSQAEGLYLAHTLQTNGHPIKKGTVLAQSHLHELAQAGIHEVYAGILPESEVDENEAAQFLSPFLANGFRPSRAATGRVNFYAQTAGLFAVDKTIVDGFNAIDPALTLATIRPDTAVLDDEMVATLKIIPMSVEKRVLYRAAEYLENRTLYRLAPFIAHEVSLFETVLSDGKATLQEKTVDVLKQRLFASASQLKEVHTVSHDPDELAQALQRSAGAVTNSPRLMIIYGASAVIDDNDVIPSAIRKAGGIVIRVGMPVEPGNLLVIGEIGDIWVIGAPGCSRSIAFNGLDIVLHRLLAGQNISTSMVAQMGVGGLLNTQKARLRVQKETPPENIRVAAIILAAGGSTRIGNPARHKLLAKLNGETLIHRVTSSALQSQCAQVTLVTGYRHADIAAAVADLPIGNVINPAYQNGMAGSIVVGVDATDLSKASGILIMLGDMPAITSVMINRLIDVFVEHRGQAIIRAVYAGKRGNPVILPKVMRDDLMQLRGDVGARALIEKADLPVIDVDIGEAAHIDVDTADAVAKIGAVFDV